MLEPRGGIGQMAVVAVQADLIDKLGRERVRVGESARLRCGRDVLALVLPLSSLDVEHAVQVARRRHVALEVRHRLPQPLDEDLTDAIVLDVSALQRPLEIDIGRRLATVGAGMEVQALDRAARQARLCVRGLPLWPDETLGQMLAGGDCGEIGLGEATLLQDIIGARVVTGAGRTLQLGATELFGLTASAARGLPSPLSLLDGHEGRGLVVCELTVRLHRAPWSAWAQGTFPATRPAVLAVLSAARALLAARQIDTLRLQESGGAATLAVRVSSLRDEGDLAVLIRETTARLAALGVALTAFAEEERRVRLGQQAPGWPESRPDGAVLELQLAWPDIPALLDVADALAARTDVPVQRAWAVGADAVRLRLQAVGPGPHPFQADAGHLLDAGALPIAGGSRWRQAVRERMSPAAKVVLTSLYRAFDPDSLVSPKSGLP